MFTLTGCKNQKYNIIRNNKYRLLGKRRLERAIPIIEPLLSHLKDYIDNHFTGSNTDLLFPKFGEGRHASGDRSKKLSDFQIINVQMMI